jgi:isoquinoline 1-oxidoreductase subunit beta
VTDIRKVSRREFLQISAIAGGGLILGWHLPSASADAGTGAFTPSAFLRIATDGTVMIIANHSEMGQGVYTSLPMIVAEELECDWEKVKVAPAPVAPAYNHVTFGPVQATGGSTSVRTEWKRLAEAGAAAREMLIAAAAKEWGVEPARCRGEEGAVLGPEKRRIGYGDLAARAAKLPVPEKVTLKDPGKYRLIGKPVHRLDTPDKVNGKAVFGIDVGEPGMLTAVIARPPVFGGKVKSFDPSKAKGVSGVRDVFETPMGVAVVAEGFWPAKKGRDLLRVEWEEPEEAKLSTESLREEYLRLARTPGATARKEGNPAAALEKSVKRLEAEYEVPYLAHAPMEPLNCFVDLKGDRCRIRVGTQGQTHDRNSAAAILGLPEERVTLETLYLGGGFGRRGNPRSDFVSEGTYVAKGARTPVKVVRTREDDMRGGWYRPMFVHRLAAGIDAAGTPLAWRHTLVGQSIAEWAGMPERVKNDVDGLSVEGAEDLPYAIPNIQIDIHTTKNAVPVQWWRSVGHSYNAFVVESFLDEVAAAAGKDPLELRRSLLRGKARYRKVLEEAADMIGWGKPAGNGRGLGIAIHASYGSIVAEAAEVSVDEKGKLRVHRISCAVDCGRFVNPDTIRAQMESGIAFGLSAALYGAITLRNGRVEQGNFDTYPILRLTEMPEVKVTIVESGEAPGGIGEPPVPPAAPAIANALFAATGARVRSLPLTPEKVLAAMRKG